MHQQPFQIYARGCNRPKGMLLLGPWVFLSNLLPLLILRIPHFQSLAHGPGSCRGRSSRSPSGATPAQQGGLSQRWQTTIPLGRGPNDSSHATRCVLTERGPVGVWTVMCPYPSPRRNPVQGQQAASSAVATFDQNRWLRGRAACWAFTECDREQKRPQPRAIALRAG